MGMNENVLRGEKMKKKKLLLGLAILATGALSLASCVSTPAPEASSSSIVNPSTSGEGSNPSQGSNASTSAYSQPADQSVINILSFGGDQESLYAEFTGISSADSYNVYVKESSASSYTKIDQQLVRLYRSSIDYYRFDAVGIKNGTYSFKIVPVSSGSEDTSKAVSKDNIAVVSYDRTGFAFSKNEYNSNGDASGAYNADGTLKSNARVIYVSSSNAKTISLSVKTSNKGEETKTGLQAILAGYEKGQENRPLAIRIIGRLSKDDLDSIGSKEEGLQIKGKAIGTMFNMTLEGIGNDATVYGFGLLVKNCTNLEVRNLGFMTKLDDDVSLDGGSSATNRNIWVHDNDFFYGANGGGDHAKGDGALDIKGTLYATLSYNHFWDSGKTTLNSNGDPVNYVSYHHNWFDHSDSRHPRVRMSNAIHVYNNYFDGVSKYGIGAAEGGTSIFSENNYYRNCKNPILSSMQGTDVYAGTTTYSRDNATFSKEDGGIIKSYGDVMVGTYTFIPYGCTTYVCKGTEKTYDLSNTTSTVNFDAYVASTRDEQVPSTVVSVQGGTSYSNFDTDSSIMYTYTVQTPEDAVNTIKNYCGRVQGGDLKWVFDNATEDTNYDVIPGLRSAIDNYSNNLVKIFGIESSTSGGSGSSEPAPTPTETTGAEVNTMIEALPEASAVTASNKTAIDAAKTAYDSLSATEKANVTSDNVTKLNACVSALASLPQSAQKLTFNSGASGDNNFFTVSGNLKSGIAAKTYNGTSYTTALKMESSTKITFTTTQTTTITIVTDTASKKIKINDKNYTTDSNGVLVVDDFAAGSVTISKGDSINVYTIIVE